LCTRCERVIQRSCRLEKRPLLSMSTILRVCFSRSSWIWLGRCILLRFLLQVLLVWGKNLIFVVLVTPLFVSVLIMPRIIIALIIIGYCILWRFSLIVLM